MIELNDMQVDGVAGGYTFGGAWTVIQALWGIGSAYVTGIGAVGQTLGNYYGRDMAVEIVAAGGMGA